MAAGHQKDLLSVRIDLDGLSGFFFRRQNTFFATAGIKLLRNHVTPQSLLSKKYWREHIQKTKQMMSFIVDKRLKAFPTL